MFSSEETQRICEHMNEDHPDALIFYAKFFGKLASAQLARMNTLNQEGFELSVFDGEKWRTIWISYPSPLPSSQHIRATLVEMVKVARAQQ